MTRKGMSSLSWGSARPPPDASSRPQRTKNTGPPGTRLRAPPPPSSILHRRFLQPPTQPPLLTEERSGGRRRRRRRRRRRDYYKPGQPGAQPPPRLLPESPATPPLPASAARHGFRVRRRINIRGRRLLRLRKPRRGPGFLVSNNRSFAGESTVKRPSGRGLPKTGPRACFFLRREVAAQRAGESGRWRPLPPATRAAL